MKQFSLNDMPMFGGHGQKIVTHPDNVALLEEALRKVDLERLPWQIDVITNKHLEKNKPTGRIVAPDGSVTERQGWTWQQDRFTVLEESDLQWAIVIGLVKEETEPLFYLMSYPWISPYSAMPMVSRPSVIIHDTF